MGRKLFASLFITILVLFQFTLFGQISEYRVGDNELLFFPTAETMPRGSFTISSMEILYLNASFGITDTTQIGISSLASSTANGISSFSISVKQQIVNRGNIKIAGWALVFPSGLGFAAGGVASIRSKSTSFHFGLGVISDLEDLEVWKNNFFMLGIRHRISKKAYLIAEYYNSFRFGFKGLLLGGIRIQSKRLSIDLGALSGITTDLDDAIIFPYLKVTLQIK